MAEAVVFSLASKILLTIASPAFDMAKEKGVFIWEARDELEKLQVSMETIHAVLLDAENKQEGFGGVKSWIKRLKGVLHDAEDLFDEVATEDLLKQQMMDGKKKLSLWNKVRVFSSKLNPVISRNSIAKKVKAIRTSLDDISRDMAKFEFVRCQDEESMFNMGRSDDRGCFVDAKSVLGRDEDMKTMLGMIINEPDSAKSYNPLVLAIVGIGGMGKSTLAQLIFNDEEIKILFKNRWFAYISDTSNEREILGKIFQSIRGESYNDLDIGQLQIKIRESLEDQKYLLVLDDVWDDDRTRWQDRISLLNGRVTESRIIVTTRLPSVTKAVGALKPYNLEGLSEDDSWSLFKMSAFSEGYVNDPRWEILGKKILKKCSGVPLAIRSIGSLLYSKSSMEEWEAIEREDLPVLGKKYNDKTMGVLKLSYDHLPSHLKHCFAYCCLFPKGYHFSKTSLINLWIAQGYIDPNDVDSGFLHLLRMGFFQEAKEGKCGQIKSCKMHDLMHDLAIHVAGEESVVSNSTSSYTRSCVRHVSVEIPKSDEPWHISTLDLNAKLLRSILLTRVHPWFSSGRVKLDQQFASFKLLRTLSMLNLGIEKISPSIGELKLMRYLDLSENNFEELPDSITYLVNLHSLNLQECTKFQVWPANFHKLTNLKYLNVGGCLHLSSMPIRIGEMIRLQYLSDFKTMKGNGCLNSSARLLQQLRGKLSIKFLSDVDGGICSWTLPVSLQCLKIHGYQGLSIPGWVNNGSTNNMTRLSLTNCTKVKDLPPLRCLPNLRRLEVRELLELEFMEEGDYVCTDHSKTTTYMFFPCLEELHLYGLPKLKHFWGEFLQFSLLCELIVVNCPKLEFNSFPLCPRLQILTVDNRQQMLPPSPTEATISGSNWQSSLASLQKVELHTCSTLKSLHLASPHLQRIKVINCHELTSVEVAASHQLQEIWIWNCNKLKSIEVVEEVASINIGSCHELQSLRIACPDSLEKLTIRRPVSSCVSMDWDSISNLGKCNCIREMDLQGVSVAFIKQLLSSSASSLESVRVDDHNYKSPQLVGL